MNRIFGPRWFFIGGEGFDRGEELLVVGPTGIPALLDNLADSGRIAHDLVQVTGRVRFFDRVALEKEKGESLGGEWTREYERKPVVVMTDLVVTPRSDVLPIVPVLILVPVVSAVPITDGLMIIRALNRSALVGRSVALFDVKVQTVVGENTFWLGPDQSLQLFVVAHSGNAYSDQMRFRHTITIAGVIPAMPSDLASMRDAWSLSAANEVTLARAAFTCRRPACMCTVWLAADRQATRGFWRSANEFSIGRAQ